MIAIIVAGAIAFIFVILSTSIGVNYFKTRNIGQPIQEEVVFHDHKKGTPTMGGVFIIFLELMQDTYFHISISGQLVMVLRLS